MKIHYQWAVLQVVDRDLGFFLPVSASFLQFMANKNSVFIGHLTRVGDNQKKGKVHGELQVCCGRGTSVFSPKSEFPVVGGSWW